ncbi:hypothetical protein ACN28E_03455 [Archangium lansingense]|uniref:hypothetical protein n=1 Tax=Archangium lansingense TaxID=2995310 RepID=UPI003B7925D8
MSLYLLETQCDGLLAQVFINGVEIYREADLVEPTFRQSKVNHWIIPGDNSIQVRLVGVPVESLIREHPRSPDFRLELKWMRETETEEPDTTTLASFRWDAEIRPLPPGVPTPVFTQTLPLPEAFGTWSWQKAALLDDDALRTSAGEIRSLVEEFHTALVRRNAASLLALQRVKHEELARALGFSLHSLESSIHEGYEELFADPHWLPMPFDRDALVLELQPNGRLVSVRGPGGLPPVIGRTQQEGLAFPIMAARIGNAWTVVR